eukprot:scpid108979/ scgid14112/ 
MCVCSLRRFTASCSVCSRRDREVSGSPSLSYAHFNVAQIEREQNKSRTADASAELKAVQVASPFTARTKLSTSCALSVYYSVRVKLSQLQPLSDLRTGTVLKCQQHTFDFAQNVALPHTNPK